MSCGKKVGDTLLLFANQSYHILTGSKWQYTFFWSALRTSFIPPFFTCYNSMCVTCGIQHFMNGNLIALHCMLNRKWVAMYSFLPSSVITYHLWSTESKTAYLFNEVFLWYTLRKWAKFHYFSDWQSHHMLYHIWKNVSNILFPSHKSHHIPFSMWANPPFLIRLSIFIHHNNI